MAHEVTEGAFRLVMSRLAGAVSIVATGSAADPSGWRGMTATAVCSLSAEPPSLVVCLNRVTGTSQRLRQHGIFSVNLLSARHVDLAATFAGRRGVFGAGRFTGDDWTTGTLDVPVLADALASFECRVSEALEYGTHVLLIGGVEKAHHTDGDPLVYHKHRFRDLGREIEMTEGSAA
ncbi:flavin reductase family protein [Micromonospora deserti]|uniref:Flavin reductase n=1 Tax=Micromonospora deserti TaxID=2070366 RepID=A0A2W2CTC2_9ACTN|nr:flavin reductase family protein [Micromonospora deserti]PZG01833.1 flavin reductase [Micromonospora deserti]